MVRQENVKVSEVETVEASESIPEVKVVKEVDIGKMMRELNFSPLENEKIEAQSEEILTGILERIPGLVVSTSPNQHIKISAGKGRGQCVGKLWFSRKKAVLETAKLDGKKYVVLASRELNEKNGLSAKNRLAISREIRRFIIDRGWEN